MSRTHASLTMVSGPAFALAALAALTACTTEQSAAEVEPDAAPDTTPDARGGADSTLDGTPGPDARVDADVAPSDTGVNDAAPPPDAALPPAFFGPESRERIAEAVAADLETFLATGAQIAVWRGGALVYVESFGFRDAEGTLPVDADTLFQIGSDTKKMTALLALQQVAAGRLTLETTVAEALPGLTLAASPDWAAKATLHHLLSHQGGLLDYTPWVENPDDAALAEVARGEFAESVWAMSEPGALWNYSNPNFSIAGYMTEVAAGRPWPDVAEQDLFAPLGMEHTFARREAAVATGNYATGTGVLISADGTASSEPVPVDIEHTIDNGFLRPAGLVWSTASDMARFGAFYLDGDPEVLPDELRTQATQKQVLLYPTVPIQGYGYGWMIFDGLSVGNTYYAQPFWSHGGNTLSETSLTWVLPEEDLSISILSNGYGDDFTSTGIALLVESGLLPAEASPPPVVPTEETDHARLAGTYHERQLGDLIVTDVGGALTIEIPSAQMLGFTYEPALAFAGYTDIYLLDAADQQFDLTFIADEAGTYTYLRNRSFVGQRVEDTPVGPGVNTPRSRPTATAFTWESTALQRRLSDLESKRTGPGAGVR